MNVLEIPFNKFLGIKRADLPGYLLMAGDAKEYSNHLGSVHASVQFALAEASSGEFLLNTFREYSDNIIPVVRRVEVKYSKPANGRIYSKAEVDAEDIERVKVDLTGKGRTLVKVNVNVYDQNSNATMQSVFEWYVQRMTTR